MPPSHPTFQAQTTAELLLEFYEDLYDEKAGIEARRDAFGTLDDGDRARLTAIQKALGESGFASDPLVEKWEREIAEGRMPDFTEGAA